MPVISDPRKAPSSVTSNRNYCMQRAYGHMQPTCQRTTSVEPRGPYSSDHMAVSSSGWSHIPGNVNVNRNTDVRTTGYQSGRREKTRDTTPANSGGKVASVNGHVKDFNGAVGPKVS
jgi:hypothetical protein